MPPLNVANPFEGCTKGLNKELDNISNSVDELVRGPAKDLADTLAGTQKTTEDDEDDDSDDDDEDEEDDDDIPKGIV